MINVGAGILGVCIAGWLSAHTSPKNIWVWVNLASGLFNIYVGLSF
jgi:hypothetical protein